VPTTAEPAGDAPILLLARDRGIARLTLNRPAVHNAFDERLIALLTGALEELGRDPAVRVVILTGAGRSFSAGADLGWMQRLATAGQEENLLDARRLARLLRTLDDLAKPTIALVNGAALGGGTGLVAAADIAIAAETASFGTTEVRLGLIPAVISPYLVAAIGPRAARRYFLTGERFDAAEARRLGLVHEVVPAAELEARGAALAEALLRGAPGAIAEAKRLVTLVRTTPAAGLAEATARAIAERRASEEGREGVAAFLEKRKPGWAKAG
jgi:methylglutaconyl-CoA hydratase